MGGFSEILWAEQAGIPLLLCDDDAPFRQRLGVMLTRKGFAVGDLSLLMSPRSVITWAENISIFHDLKLAFELSFLNKCEPAERAIVTEYFQRCFGQELAQPEEPVLAFVHAH